MKCSKCDGTTLMSRTYVRRELAKGSPKRGKNKKWIEVPVREVKCKDCQTTELTYG